MTQECTDVLENSNLHVTGNANFETFDRKGLKNLKKLRS